MNTEITSSILNTEKKRDKRLDNLAPQWKPGQITNPKGRGKGNVSLKTRLKRILTRESADEISRTIIQMAKAGSIQASKLICELTGDIDNTPKININNNTLTISDAIMEKAREYSRLNPIQVEVIAVLPEATVEALPPIKAQDTPPIPKTEPESPPVILNPPKNMTPDERASMPLSQTISEYKQYQANKEKNV